MPRLHTKDAKHGLLVQKKPPSYPQNGLGRDRGHGRHGPEHIRNISLLRERGYNSSRGGLRRESRKEAEPSSTSGVSSCQSDVRLAFIVRLRLRHLLWPLPTSTMNSVELLRKDARAVREAPLYDDRTAGRRRLVKEHYLMDTCSWSAWSRWMPPIAKLVETVDSKIRYDEDGRY